MQGFLPPFKHFATDAIHAGQDPEQWRSGAVVPPISLSTTFKQRAPGEHAVSAAATGALSHLQGHRAPFRAWAHAGGRLAYSSGLAALLNICHLLKTGDSVICMDDVYGGTNRYFQKVASENNLKVIFVDCTKPKCLEAAITPETKLVWLETPTNPTLKVIDIKACAEVAHSAGGKDVLLAVDNSFMSAYFQVCHLPQGRWIGKGMGKGLYQNYFPGDQAEPWCCRFKVTLFAECKVPAAPALPWNSLGILPTLPIPGLPSHPQYEVMKKQCTGCPGMVSFYIKGKKENASAFLRNLKVFALAESLGGFESLAEHPAIMTHASVPEEERKTLGISDTLIRLSVGLEDEEDLLADLDQALKAAVSEEFPSK
ncbi:CGL lyase, partial [Rhodinocichla rosea]|nr:CGL lyase [Rhodinocichla rosea]